MNRVLKSLAIVIKRRNYGESDRVVTVFSKEFGKLSIKASGVRKITSRRSGNIELVNLTQLTLYKNNSSTMLTEAQTVNDFFGIKSNLEKVGFAYHMCELIDGLCPEDQENGLVFSLLLSSLEKLEKTEDILMVIHEFEIELLTILGFWNKPQSESKDMDTQIFIENILERKLKSRKIFSKIN